MGAFFKDFGTDKRMCLVLIATVLFLFTMVWAKNAVDSYLLKDCQVHAIDAGMPAEYVKMACTGS